MFQIDQIAQTIETVALQAINLSQPETIEQGIENLKGLKILVDSALARNIEQLIDNVNPVSADEINQDMQELREASNPNQF